MKFATNPSSHSRSPVLANLAAALLADETTAQAIQLYTEYDPQPPFDSGSMAKVSPEVLECARALSYTDPTPAFVEPGRRAPRLRTPLPGR